MSRPRRSIVAPKAFGNVVSASDIASLLESTPLPTAPAPAPAAVDQTGDEIPPAPGGAPAAQNEGAEAQVNQEGNIAGRVVAPVVAPSNDEQQYEEESDDDSDGFTG